MEFASLFNAEHEYESEQRTFIKNRMTSVLSYSNGRDSLGWTRKWYKFSLTEA